MIAYQIGCLGLQRADARSKFQSSPQATGTPLALSNSPMKLPLVLALAALTAATPAVSHAQPRLPPSVTNRAQQNDVLYWYAQLPPRHFAAFGNADRRQLLQQKGAIYDAQRGFLEVPVPGDPNKNDVEKLQVKLYRAKAGLIVAVSQIVFAQPNVPGELTLYGVTGAGTLLDVTPQFFPYDLQPAPTNGKPAPFENAYLPRGGTTIETGAPDAKAASAQYGWNGERFTRQDEAKNTGN